ncbi:hypothetical protein V6Z11_A12G125800 [Gossypium hirsutum]
MAYSQVLWRNGRTKEAARGDMEAVSGKSLVKTRFPGCSTSVF